MRFLNQLSCGTGLYVNRKYYNAQIDIYKMIIPEDGGLPPVGRTNLTGFCNVMIVKLSENLEDKLKLTYNLVTLDSKKNGEQWPAENSCKETTESVKESNVPEVTGNVVNSTNIKKSKDNVMNKQPVTSLKKTTKKNQRMVNNKPKFVKKNMSAETQKYHDIPAIEIDPWLPTPTILSTNMAPAMYNHPTNFYNVPLLDGNGHLLQSKGLLGNGPNDLINNAPIINNMQGMLARNITSTNLPMSDCHGNRKMLPVNSSFDHTNFRNKLISKKYDNRFDDSYRDNSAEMFPYNRNYSSAERDKSSNSPHFQNRSETRIGNYHSNYVPNVDDQIVWDDSYENYDATRIAGCSRTYAPSHRKDPLISCYPGPSEESFMRTERDFPGDVLDGNVTDYRNIHPQKFARNGSSEVFEETNGGCYGGDVSYNTGYNEMPRNNFPTFQSFQNNFRNNCGDEQRKSLNENGYMGTNRDYYRNHRGSEDSPALNKSYETYEEMHRDNTAEFYGQYDNERVWKKGCEPNPGFHGNYAQERKSFYRRNKKFPHRKGSFRNARWNTPTRSQRNRKTDGAHRESNEYAPGKHKRSPNKPNKYQERTRKQLSKREKEKNNHGNDDKKKPS